MRVIFITLHTFLSWLIANIPGGIGQKVRFFYWKYKFLSCGKNVRIDQGVIFHNPENIIIGNNVWIHSYSIITAPSNDQNNIASNKTMIGEDHKNIVEIGDEVQIGLFNVINGIGGLSIGNCVTLSAYVSIYSATHLPNNPNDYSMKVGNNGMVSSRPVFSKQSNIIIGQGAWLGLGVMLICASIGNDSFIKSATIVTKNIKENAVFGLNGYEADRYKES